MEHLCCDVGKLVFEFGGVARNVLISVVAEGCVFGNLVSGFTNVRF